MNIMDVIAKPITTKCDLQQSSSALVQSTPFGYAIARAKVPDAMRGAYCPLGNRLYESYEYSNFGSENL